MRFRHLNPISSRIEEASSSGCDLFVQVKMHRRSGPGVYTAAPLSDFVVPLDDLIGLIVERLSVLDAAAAAELEAEKVSV